VNDLTPRELEVLSGIASGLSTKEVAIHLGITFKTAACHRHRVMQKIGVHGTGQLVRFAIANGIVAVPSP
jgi:DNA-binding NarL/FixJ family response regulator